MMRPVVVAVPPEAPSSLVATGLTSPKRVRLTWTNTALNATGLTVQRATDAAFTQGLVNVKLAGTNVTTYDDSTVAQNVTYYYRVVAANTVGSSVAGYPQMTVTSISNVVTAGPPMDPPSNLAGTQAARGQPVVLTWKDNSPNVPNPPNFNSENNFVVQRATSSTGSWSTLATLAANSVTYADSSGLKNTTTYFYRVQATNIFGGTTSNVFSITTK